ncbi:hypothetical protein V1477_012341 [Vespula maculifrons]|uniref:Uncharacterized protein n=1 Tax=Vespula maculifrons TaxID=7453 RepID=A0ABD2BXB9_VESMC
MGHIYHHGAGCSSCEGSTKAVLKYKKNHSSSSSPGAGCLSCKGSTKTPIVIAIVRVAMDGVLYRLNKIKIAN